VAAVDWLVCAQEATRTGAFPRQYAVCETPGAGRIDVPPPCPGTTGLTVPTLYLAARYLDRSDLTQRAAQAALWGVQTESRSGAVPGGVIGTGGALLGYLAAFAETGSGVFAGTSRRAGRFLLATLDDDGMWRREGRHCARAAWALAEAGRRLRAPEFRAAAAKHLRAVAHLQREDGWLPDFAFPERSLSLANIADSIRGLLEGGRVLGDERLIAGAALAAGAVADALGPEGELPRRFAPDWQPAVSPPCLVGQAQMANVWLRLFEITGADGWLEPVRRTLRFLKAASPWNGAMMATKFLVDALIRDESAARGIAAETTARVLA
jgi:hypothetical protein